MLTILAAYAAVPLLLFPAALSAEDQPSEPRFTVSPAAEGFIRLDTATGAITECRRPEGDWVRKPVIEDASALEAAVKALADRVEAIDRRLEGPETLGAHAGRSPGETPAAAPAPAQAGTPSLPERMVRKLFLLVAAVKRSIARA